jgi:excisionase family DNA binding protein
VTEPGGTIWLSVPEAARRLGISERAVRKRIDAGTLRAERDGGGPWRVEVGTADAVPESAPGGTRGGTQEATAAEPIEAAYQVAGDGQPGAVLVPLQTMVEELRGLADQLADLARRNEGLALEVGTLRERVAGHEGQLAAKDETIITQQEAIAELRRRAEVAEAELSRQRDDVQPVAQAEGEQPPAYVSTFREGPEGLWRRLGRWWRGAGREGGA